MVTTANNIRYGKAKTEPVWTAGLVMGLEWAWPCEEEGTGVGGLEAAGVGGLKSMGESTGDPLA